MIRHCVMLRLAADADVAVVQQVCTQLDELVQGLEGLGGFVAGPNRDFEGKSPGFDYGFTLDADDSAALQVYADHPSHRALGQQLVALCQGGAEGIMVFDLEVPE